MKTYQEFTIEAYRFTKRSGLKHKDPFTKYDPGTKPKYDPVKEPEKWSAHQNRFQSKNEG